MMKYDFETCIDKRNSGSVKWRDMLEKQPDVPEGVVPLSVADMEFKTAPEITAGLKEMCIRDSHYPAKGGRRHMKKILIIEDDASIAELERDYLMANGFEVTVIGDGREGLRKALEEEFALIVLDVMLPGADGFEICTEIRAHKNTPVLMVSARRDDVDKVKGLGLGADDYMVKPFSPSELVARVRAHISRYERLTNKAEGSTLSVRGLTIDIPARRVYVQGEEAVLKNKEFELLLFGLIYTSRKRASSRQAGSGPRGFPFGMMTGRAVSAGRSLPT